MRKVILYIAMSLDGYIADDNGGVDWLLGEDHTNNEDNGYSKFIEHIDTIIMGKTTYNQIVNELSIDVWPYPQQTSYIITSSKIDYKENIIAYNGNIKDLVTKLKQENGKDIWLVGGAQLVKYFMKNDLIDQWQISIIPSIIGMGIKLFKEGNYLKLLHLESTSINNGICELVYTRRNLGDE